MPQPQNGPDKLLSTHRPGMPLGVRLTLWFFLLAIVPLAVMAIFMGNNVTQSYTGLVLRFQAQESKALASKIGEFSSLSRRRGYLSSLDSASGQKLFLLDSSGNYLYHPDPARLGKPAASDFSAPAWYAILTQNEGAYWDASRGLSLTHQRTPSGGQILVMAKSIAQHTASLNRLERSSLAQLAVSLSIISLAAGLVIWLLVGSPIRRLARAAEVFGIGFLDTRVDPEGMADELELLGRTFNQMAGRIQELVQGYERQVKELEHSQATLAESENRVWDLYVNASDSIWMLDVDPEGGLKVAGLNPAAEKTFRVSSPDVIGKPLADVFPRRMAQGLAGYFAATIARGQNEVFELSGPMAGGIPVTWEMNVVLARGEAGRVDRLVIFSREVTEKRRMEDELRQSRANLLALIENPKIGVWSLNREHRLITFNSTLNRQIKAFSGQDLQPGATIPARDLESGRFWDEKFAQAFAGEQVRFEFDVDAPGQKLAQEVFLNPIVTDGVITGASAIAFDISERRKVQQQARELGERLRQAQKMEVVGQLAGGIAHDFNNLLTGILGYAEMLVRKLKSGTPLRRHAESILQTALIASQFTRQLLAISRRQVVQPEILDLNTHLKELNKTLQRLIGEHIQIAFEPSAAACVVKADPGQLTQVVLNLVANARDAMPGGGRLSLRTSVLELKAENPLPDEGMIPGSWVLLEVSDNGLGMDEATRARIFEPFFTTKEAGRSSGLGLATLWGIVKQNGGHVAVDSEKGRGSTFRVYLPGEGASLPGPAAPPNPEISLKGRETVLLTEDDEVTMEISMATLTSFGYKVLPARHPDQALEILKAFKGEVHLLLTDMVMPGMNGRELARRVQALRPGVKTLFTSGYTQDGEFIRGVAEGRFEFIEKPFTALGLAKKVRQVLGEPNKPAAPHKAHKKTRSPKKRRA